jgi:hypothetical protein
MPFFPRIEGDKHDSSGTAEYRMTFQLAVVTRKSPRSFPESSGSRVGFALSLPVRAAVHIESECHLVAAELLGMFQQQIAHVSRSMKKSDDLSLPRGPRHVC